MIRIIEIYIYANEIEVKIERRMAIDQRVEVFEADSSFDQA